MGGTMMKKKIIAAALTAVILINSVCFSAAAIQGDALIGDVNHDGIVNIDDATVVQRIVAGLEEIGEQNTEERLADADGNGVCDITDVTAIQRYCADMVSNLYPVGKAYSAVYSAFGQQTEPQITDTTSEAVWNTTSTATAPLLTEAEPTESQTTALAETTTEATEPTELLTTAPTPSYLKLDTESVKLGDNEDYQLNVESDVALEPSQLQFSTTNEAIVSVDAGGRLTAVQKGETDVICRYDSLSAVCHVTVCPAAQSLSLNQDTLLLGTGEVFDLDSYVNSGAAAYYRAYSSDNEAVAAVTKAGGYVTAKGVGTANISCTLRNGIKAVCKVTVERMANDVTLNRTELTMGIGEMFDFDSTVSDGAAYFRAYSSDDDSIVSVTEGYGYATAKKVGVTNIRCTLMNGVEAVCQVTVKPMAPTISLNRTEVTLAGGEQFDFNSSVPSGTAAYYRAYYSENPSVARIAADGGLMTAVRAGTTRIYCELQNGTRVYAVVKVTPAVRKLMIDYLNEQIGNNSRSYINYVNQYSDYGCHSETHWCAVFAWCALDHVAEMLGKSNPVIATKYVSDIAEDAKDEHALRNVSDTGYVPSPGDLFLTANSAYPKYGARNHIGFVEWVERDSRGNVIRIHTIEGNYGWETHSPSVTRVTRSVLYPDKKDSYGMFISEYINIEYLFPNT